MRKLVLALSAALVLAACGGTPTSSSTPPPTSPTITDSTDIAYRLNCTYEKEDEPELFASESGTCSNLQAEYGVAFFANSDAQKNWYDMAKQAGGYYLLGNDWIVWADTQSLIDEAKSKLT